MGRMLELVRSSQLSYHQMVSASRGALRLPPAETLEILVYIAEHNKIFRDQARLTIAAWDEASAKAIAGDPSAPIDVLHYWSSPNNVRPALLPILLENPSVLNSMLGALATSLKGELLDVMIASPRVRDSHHLMHDLSTNHHLNGAQAARLRELMGVQADAPESAQEVPQTETTETKDRTCQAEEIQAQAKDENTAEPAAEVSPVQEAASVQSTTDKQAENSPEPQTDPETEKVVGQFLTEHAAEIKAEGNKPFQPIGGIHEEVSQEQPQAAAVAAAAGGGSDKPATNPAHAAHKPLVNPEDQRRGSALQKISQLDVKGRIQLGMKGNKEERSILVRDGTKLVALAVLDSPKITDSEVEKFASQKNVLEALLRAIPMKRRFVKNYAVVRNLVFNPRTPLDVSLGLMKNLLIADLKNLLGNREVADTVRKLALRMFKQKTEPNSSG